MYLNQNRFLSILAATTAALALGAAPALAGEDEDGDDDEGSAPAQTAPSSGGAGSGAPQGGVATGAGGTAPLASPGPDAVLLGLASGALVLMATGGGMLRAARRHQA
jgi:hypothetical protein